MASIFSRIIDGEIPGSFACREERWVAILDINPVSPGHILAIPKQEAPLLTDLSSPTLEDMGSFLAKLDKALRSVTGCDAVSVLLRDGAAAGQEVPHLHVHLVPRYTGDQPHHFGGGTYTEGAMEDMRSSLEQALAK